VWVVGVWGFGLCPPPPNPQTPIPNPQSPIPNLKIKINKIKIYKNILINYLLKINLINIFNLYRKY